MSTTNRPDTDPIMVSTRLVEAGDLVRFTPRDRRRPVTIKVSHGTHTDSGSILSGRRARLEGNELDGYSTVTSGEVHAYLAPAEVEVVAP